MRSIALVALVGVAVACSGGDDAAPPSTESGLSTTVAGDAEVGEWSVGWALSEIPAGGATEFELSTGNVAAVADVFGVTPPDDLADHDDALNGWLLPLTYPGVADYRDLPVWLNVQEPLVPTIVTDMAVFDDLVGWSLRDVDAFVDYRPPAPGYLVVARGAFDEGALAGLAEVAPGIVTTHAGDDLATDIANIHPLDRLGRAIRLARHDDRIAMSLTTALAERWTEGQGSTLADDGRLAAVAGALDDAGVLMAHVFRNDFSVGSALRAVSAEHATAITDLVDEVPPFDTVGIGWAIDAEGEAVTVLAVAPIDGDAAALAAELETSFAEGVSLVSLRPVSEVLGATDFEITAGDRVVTVTYQPRDAFWWTAAQTVFQRDLPFLHG